MLVSLIVPCYNEEPAIDLFYKEVISVIEGLHEYEFELLFVNDGSRDGTISVLRRLADADERVKYISFSRNFGKEAAILAGLKKSRGDICGVMDADLQDPPSLLPQMLEQIADGYDSVATRRVNRRGEPPIRSFFARSFYRIINKLSDTDIVDGARDYRLMTRPVVDAVLSLEEYHRFSKGIFGWVGFETKWLEYENSKRVAGETKWSFWKLFRYAVEGIVGFSTVPLRFATVTGVLTSMFAFMFLLYVFIKTLVVRLFDLKTALPDVNGYPSLMVVQLFLGGIILISIGILGEYLSKTYMETKKRPHFIIKESNIKEERNCESGRD